MLEKNTPLAFYGKDNPFEQQFSMRTMVQYLQAEIEFGQYYSYTF